MTSHNFGRLCACASLLAVSSASPAAIVISEVLVDADGSDNGKVFVELFGDPGTDLGGLALQEINGSGGGVTRTTVLSGIIPADGVLVIADDDGSGATQVPNADLVVQLTLQNGPDSLQLISGASVLDALGYGDFGAGDVFAGEGVAAATGLAGESLARLSPWLDTDDNAADFSLLSPPTPGSVPAAVSAVPLPASLWLLGSGCLGLIGLGRRRGG